MTDQIPEPVRGEDVLPWARSVTNVCRIVSAVGSGQLVREGVGGIGFEGLPENRRGKRPATALRPWHISYGTRTEWEEGRRVEKTVRVFADCYYMAGQVMLRYEPKEDGEAVEDFVCQGELEPDEEYTDADRPFICFRYRTGDAYGPSADAEIVGFKSYEEMYACMTDRTVSVIPLYQLTHSGAVKLDFRGTPQSQEFELT